MISLNKTFDDIIDIISNEYQANDLPWYLAYSGGKDSTAVLILVYNMLLRSQNNHKDVNVIYCNTRVEMPCINTFAINTLYNLEIEARRRNIPLNITIAEPQIKDSFFVKVIGRGYMPPSHLFRWCTNRLRIIPLQREINKSSQNIVLLGTRNDESGERNRVLKAHRIDEFHYKQTDYRNSIIFAPIINFSIKDVWECISLYENPLAVDRQQLKHFYKSISTNNSLIEKGSGRFGCWVCTVIREDKAGQALSKNGYNEMTSLLQYRQLLIRMKNDESLRWKHRRNGDNSKGPFKISARKILLDELLKTQKESNLNLITSEEIDYIHSLWEKDQGIEC